MHTVQEMMSLERQKATLKKKIQACARLSKSSPKIPQSFIDKKKAEFFAKGGKITKIDPVEIDEKYHPYNNQVSHILTDMELMEWA